MFENIFKKDPAQGSEPGGTPQRDSAQTSAEDHRVELQAWRERIAAATSDDSTLLLLAHQAPTVELKLAALQALGHEESLKQAMHDFRDIDKRLYRAAKSRWQAANGKRITVSDAHQLIAGARLLLEQDSVPANRIVDLDRQWSALDAAFLDAELQAEHAVLREQLGAKLRARGEGEQAVVRWLAATSNAIEGLRDSLTAVAQGDSPPGGASVLAAGLLELLGSVPDVIDVRCTEQADAATRVLALASSVVQRAEFLQELPVSGAGDEADEKLKIGQWRGFPEVSATALQSVLARRFADWRNAGNGERQRELDERRAREHEVGAEQNEQRLNALRRDLEAAEAAHAAGNVSELTRLMGELDRGLKAGRVTAAFAQRIDALRQEQKRLRDWQRWSGRQGREQLVAEAQALAASVAEKIAIKAHADAIEKLRARWRELDKLGGATNQALWLAFDGALTTAYVPVAAHLEKLKAARNDNLVARNQIVDALIQAAGTFFSTGETGTAIVPLVAPDWRAVARTVEDAKMAWRKLGPVEHTVPRKAQHGDNAVTVRYANAVQALEAPLAAVLREATGEREKLIAAAKDLAGDASARDALDRVRALQSQWQAHAKSLTLPRRDENRLWNAFKAATDARFAARDAARNARDVEFSAKIKAREAIVEALTALPPAATASDVKRIMVESDVAWRVAAEIPRPQAAKLDARYRAARDAATKRIANLAVSAAQARYDALIAKMALCHEREVAAGAAAEIAAEQAADYETRWNAIENLPESWNAALDARFRGADSDKSVSASGERLRETLLNLEVASGLESPNEFVAARQLLKLRALKSAMEGRQAIVTTPSDIERWLLSAASTPFPDDMSRERLSKLIAALRLRR